MIVAAAAAGEPADPPTLVLILIPILFPIVFVSFWCLVVYLISRFGWAGMAKDFATDTHKPEGGTSFYGISGRFGLMAMGNYKSVLNVTLLPQGIHLTPNVLFRFGHQPLLIPWEKVSNVEQRSLGPFKDIVVTMTHNGANFHIFLPVNSLNKLEGLRPGQQIA